MAIQLYCSDCYSTSALNSNKCTGCGKVFGRDRKYRVRVSMKGKRVTRVVDNLTIAKEVESSIKADLLRDEYEITSHKVSKTVTLGDVWAQYLPWAKEQKKSWRDDEYYYRKHLEPRFASKAMESITPFDIEKMKTELKKGLNAQGKPYAAQTIKHQIVIMRRLYNLARKWDLYDGKNPVDSVQMPKVDNQRTEFLTDNELTRLKETLDTWPCRDSVAFVKFAMLSGVRRGELFKLTWDAVDFERNMVSLRDPKGGKTTTLPMNSQAMEVLRSLDVTSPFVFPGKDGKKRTDFSGPWLKIRKAAELQPNFRFCGLRHNFASHLVSNGVGLGVVRDLLTHKHVGTTERYAHFAPDAVKAAAEKAGELLTPKQGQVLKIVK